MKIALVILFIIIVLIAFWWIFGGMHLDYLDQNAHKKIRELDFDSCITEGYKRRIFGGFGGCRWYLCEKNNVYYSFYIARRINNPELQLYWFTQVTKFPNSFDIITK